MSEFINLPVIDCHLHFHPRRRQLSEDELKRVSEFIVEVTQKGRLSQIYMSGGNAGLYLKATHPGLFYTGGYVPWSGEVNTLPNPDWRSYIGSLTKMGFDGIGEMGSKPVPREKHTPLDSKYYEDFWSTCEASAYPVLCHVADPEEFWDKNLAPEWAKKRGWVYYLGDYPSKEELYKEMENVLDAHSRLRIVLCHFYFMSANLERTEDFLDRYGNANLDLTLGIELMHNISSRRDDWREFFIKHQNRILFGTDISTWQEIQQAVDRIWLIRNFLESDEEFFTPPTADMLLTRYKEPYLGLELPRAVLEKIYAGNFQRLWGRKPRKVDLKAAIEACERREEKTIADALRKIGS